LRTAGESHGEALVAILEGIPAGLRLDLSVIDEELRRRQQGHGRSRRMRLERDRARILAGWKRGVTIGSPLALLVENADRSIDRLPNLEAPRPGHADLAGCFKFGTRDVRAVLERASARETAARVAAGGVARLLLREVGVEIFGHVLSVGEARARKVPPPPSGGPLDEEARAGLESLRRARDASPFFCLDPSAEAAMREAVDDAQRRGDTLGGTFEMWGVGVAPGIGSFARAEERLDARLAGALVSIPAVKGAEIGLGFESARRPGSKVHDSIVRRTGRGWGGIARPTNRAGGVEGGVSNGETIVVRGAMKPLPTLREGLPSVNLETGRPQRGTFQRSDVCAVPAASVVGEAVVALVLAAAYLEKFPGDTLGEVRRGGQAYCRCLSEVLGPAAEAGPEVAT
jgi:chorismate synthase